MQSFLKKKNYYQQCNKIIFKWHEKSNNYLLEIHTTTSSQSVELAKPTDYSLDSSTQTR